MIKPEKADQTPLKSKEGLESGVEFAKGTLHSNLKSVNDQIDKISTRGAKRVLKAIGNVFAADEILTGKKPSLRESEQKLIDWMFQLQSNVYGYVQLKKELEEFDKPKTQKDEKSDNKGEENE